MYDSVIDGRYRITRKIGEGAMGTVYEAEHLGVGKLVAVKVLSVADLAKKPATVKRFQREARAAGTIDTRHIVEVFDTGTEAATGRPYMVMELLKGEDLRAVLRRMGPLGPELALKIVAQACTGLRKAHEAGVVHRDIKPANLFLAEKDDEIVVKILDFGIAKICQDSLTSTADSDLTRTGSMLGSPLYMSPEQARGHKTIDHRADLWSLGIVLYQLLCGRTPFQHIDGLGELIISICGDPAPPLQQFAPWVPPEVAALVERATQIVPAERFQTAAEMADALRALLPHGLQLSAGELRRLDDLERSQVAEKHVSTADALATTASSSSTRTAMTRPGGGAQPPPPGPPLTALIAGGALAVALGAAGAVYLLATPAADQPAEPAATAPAQAGTAGTQAPSVTKPGTKPSSSSASTRSVTTSASTRSVTTSATTATTTGATAQRTFSPVSRPTVKPPTTKSAKPSPTPTKTAKDPEDLFGGRK